MGLHNCDAHLCKKQICTVCIKERYIAYGDDSLTLRLVSKLPDLRVANAKWIQWARLIEPHRIKLHSYDAHLCIIAMERSRSGHNGADSKSVCAKAHEGSNPSLSAKGGFIRTNHKDNSLWFSFIKPQNLRQSETKWYCLRLIYMILYAYRRQRRYINVFYRKAFVRFHAMVEFQMGDVASAGWLSNVHTM